ncbi:MAG TPA: L-threonylcarbamoyladenylate synthase [Phycisphaerae bacterium]|nr:L-threonylcarbamoyladenylate synthase [Phycisphaerae bacterium]
MAAEIISIDADTPDTAAIGRAAKALADGALVAFPTETVYGLAANAGEEKSVQRLRDVKGRQETQPFTVHIGRPADVDAFVPTVSSLGRRFIRKAWPGPLTLVFKVADSSKAAIYSKLSDAGRAAIYSRGSVGVRYPDLRAADEFLTAAGVPVIASSANRSGSSPPVSAADVSAALGNDVDYILDAGATRYRKGSTIVELENEHYKVLREGVWDERTVRRLSSLNILFVCTGNTCRSPIAEAVCKKILAQKLGCGVAELESRGIHVMSAGTTAYGGGRASEESVVVSRKRGMDLSSHVSRPLTPELLRSADHVFTMTRQHLETLRYLAPGDGEKASTLLSDGDIPDPVGGPMEDYERVASQIEAALASRMEEVKV